MYWLSKSPHSPSPRQCWWIDRQYRLQGSIKVVTVEWFLPVVQCKSYANIRLTIVRKDNQNRSLPHRITQYIHWNTTFWRVGLNSNIQGFNFHSSEFFSISYPWRKQRFRSKNRWHLTNCNSRECIAQPISGNWRFWRVEFDDNAWGLDSHSSDLWIVDSP